MGLSRTAPCPTPPTLQAKRASRNGPSDSAWLHSQRSAGLPRGYPAHSMSGSPRPPSSRGCCPARLRPRGSTVVQPVTRGGALRSLATSPARSAGRQVPVAPFGRTAVPVPQRASTSSPSAHSGQQTEAGGSTQREDSRLTSPHGAAHHAARPVGQPSSAPTRHRAPCGATSPGWTSPAPPPTLVLLRLPSVCTERCPTPPCQAPPQRRGFYASQSTAKSPSLGPHHAPRRCQSGCGCHANSLARRQRVDVNAACARGPEVGSRKRGRGRGGRGCNPPKERNGDEMEKCPLAMSKCKAYEGK